MSCVHFCFDAEPGFALYVIETVQSPKLEGRKDNVSMCYKQEKEEKRGGSRERGGNEESVERFITVNQGPECLFSLIMHMSRNTIRCAVGMPQN